MKNNLKRFISIVVFCLLFVILFLSIQEVLHYRWSGNEDVYTRNLNYAAQHKDSIDVLYFGTSEVYAGVAPIVTYKESGITGYNFAISYRSAVTVYYQLKYALKYQAPKVVMCDFSSLYESQLPSDVEQLYRKVVDTMPDKAIKNELIADICQLDKNQSYLSWKYPILRYHSMWNELSEENFEKDYVYDSEYKSYSKGALLNNVGFNLTQEPFEITSDLWNYENEETEFSEISVKYYDMFIEECQKRGIRVVALLLPKLNEAALYAARWNAMKDYFDSRGVDYLNYNTYEQVKRLGVTLEDDYYDVGHFNFYGSIKFSKILASDLKAKYSFDDRRMDESINKDWDEAWNKFCLDYNLDA